MSENAPIVSESKKKWIYIGGAVTLLVVVFAVRAKKKSGSPAQSSPYVPISYGMPPVSGGIAASSDNSGMPIPPMPQSNQTDWAGLITALLGVDSKTSAPSPAPAPNSPPVSTQPNSTGATPPQSTSYSLKQIADAAATSYAQDFSLQDIATGAARYGVSGAQLVQAVQTYYPEWYADPSRQTALISAAYGIPAPTSAPVYTPPNIAPAPAYVPPPPAPTAAPAPAPAPQPTPAPYIEPSGWDYQFGGGSGA